MGDIARAFALMAKQHGQTTILVGRDNRLSSPLMRDKVVEALLDSSCNVVDLGLVITPMFYYGARQHNIPAGIMITASHNPGNIMAVNYSWGILLFMANRFSKSIS